MLCNVIIGAVVPDLAFTDQLTIWWWEKKILIYQFLVSPGRTLKKKKERETTHRYFVEEKGPTIRIEDSHFLFFGREAFGILVPQPATPAVEAQSLNHWTARKFPKDSHFQGSWQLYVDICRCMFLILIFT